MKAKLVVLYRGVRRVLQEMGLWASVALVLAFAVVLMVIVTWVLTLTVAAARVPTEVLKVALTIVAGFGGIVALVVAYRRQRDSEHTKFNALFDAAAQQLGGDNPALRIAGIYSMVAAADSTTDVTQRQQCINVLCAYLGSSFSEGAAGGDVGSHEAPGAEAVGNVDGSSGVATPLDRADRQMSRLIVRVLAQHLVPGVTNSWSRHHFDFSDAYLVDADFSGCVFESTVWFPRAVFSGEHTIFANTVFHGRTRFDGCRFLAGTTNFRHAEFTCPVVIFKGAVFAGGDTSSVTFVGAKFNNARQDRDPMVANFSDVTFASAVSFAEMTTSSVGMVFDGSRFRGAYTFFSNATFDSLASFRGVEFAGSTDFREAKFRGDRAHFGNARFIGSSAFFTDAEFSATSLSFENAEFRRPMTSFQGATFTSDRTSFNARFGGAYTNFAGARFTGTGQVAFGSERVEMEWKSGEPAVFDGGSLSFDGVTFDNRSTSFRGTKFDLQWVSILKPQRWNNVHFDWDDDERAPAWVMPKQWPPPLAADEHAADRDGGSTD